MALHVVFSVKLRLFGFRVCALSHAARSHLQRKYEFLEAKSLVHWIEELIERMASYSSFSGEPYRVRCKGGPDGVGGVAARRIEAVPGVQ
jgi:hypothetical protein